MRWLLLTALLSLGVAACGTDDNTSTEDAAREAGQLAESTQELAGDVARTGRTMVDEPQRADEAREQLGDLEDRARDLADQAGDLPESTNVRDELREANERVAAAAEQLQDADRSDLERALEDARDQLTEGDRQIGDVADRLEKELPAGAQDELERLRDGLPEEQ